MTYWHKLKIFLSSRYFENDFKSFTSLEKIVDPIFFIRKSLPIQLDTCQMTSLICSFIKPDRWFARIQWRSQTVFMAEDSRHFTDIKDIRPGIKNLHCLFIVLEVGKAALSSDSLPVWSEAKISAISCRESNQNQRCSCRSGMPRSRQNRLDNGVCLGWSRRNPSTRRYH